MNESKYVHTWLFHDIFYLSLQSLRKCRETSKCDVGTYFCLKMIC